MLVVYRGRLETRKERVVYAAFGYGIGLALLLLALVVGDVEALRYLLVGGLIFVGSTTGILLISIGARRSD
jgi:hypothetical protein